MTPEDRKHYADALRLFADKLEKHTGGASGEVERTAGYADHSHFSWEHSPPKWRTHETLRVNITLDYTEPLRRSDP